jgi:hypothetical protein
VATLPRPRAVMARMWGRSCRPEEPSHDDSSDHNRDDSCTPNYGNS